MVKKIHLDIKDATTRITKLQQQLQKQQTIQNKTKRKRIYYQLGQLKKAVQQPQKLLIDPVQQTTKKKQQQQKRVLKKIEKKKQEVLTRKKEKRHQKRCLKCGSRDHLLGQCTNTAIINNKIHKNGQNNQTSGFCYKCGSTEHSHKQCSELQYKLAVCFYCGNQGHIARQCPKNEKGLFRKGGSCFGCGSVRHTLKNCPTRQKGREGIVNNKQQF